MKLTKTMGSIGLLAVVGAALRQHQHHLDNRRARAQDRQHLWYDHEAFHVVTFLRSDPETEAVDAVRAFHHATRNFRDVEWVYAGKAMLNGTVSGQIGHVEWDAVVVLQYPSAKDYQLVSRSLVYQRALEAFPDTYSMGFQRPRAANVATPQVLGLRRVVQRLRREQAILPFEPSATDTESTDLGFVGSLDELLTERQLGAEGAVVINLIKRGGEAQRAADRRYARRMMRVMAEGGFGPIHLGRAVPVEGDDHFDAVAIVYYPGLQFLADMASSEFFRQGSADKQPEDLQTVVTAPILYRL